VGSVVYAAVFQGFLTTSGKLWWRVRGRLPPNSQSDSLPAPPHIPCARASQGPRRPCARSTIPYLPLELDVHTALPGLSLSGREAVCVRALRRCGSVDIRGLSQRSYSLLRDPRNLNQTAHLRCQFFIVNSCHAYIITHMPASVTKRGGKRVSHIGRPDDAGPSRSSICPSGIPRRPKPT
jgi:hypothetical protein